MQPKTPQASQTSAVDVFLHLFWFILLYLTAFSLAALLFDYVDVLYPPLFNYLGSNSIVTEVSILLVAWPVFFLTNWVLGKIAKKTPDIRRSVVRKWLVYLTLFVTALTLVIDLITIVYNFLSGGLSVSFGLKTLAVLIVAGLMFGYFLWDVRKGEISKMVVRIFAWGTSALLLISIVAGFVIAGTPAEQRRQRQDQQRVSDLQNIQSEVFAYYATKEALPATLDQLRSDVTGFVPPRDPETEQAYEYQASGDLSFELCATFGAEDTDGITGGFEDPYNGRVLTPIYPGFDDTAWAHPIGRTCFDRTIDPEQLKQIFGDVTSREVR